MNEPTKAFPRATKDYLWQLKIEGFSENELTNIVDSTAPLSMSTFLARHYILPQE